MVSLEQVEAMIKAEIPDAIVKVQDLKGGGDHLQAVVVSAEFADKPLVKQHRMVYNAIEEAMATGAIHALALNTYTPEAWYAAGQPIS